MQDWMLDFAEYVRALLPELAEPFTALGTARPRR